MVLALNTVSGQIADVSPRMLEHSHFKNYLELVDENAKPYVAELYTSGTVEEKATSRKGKNDPVVAEAATITEEEI